MYAAGAAWTKGFPRRLAGNFLRGNAALVSSANFTLHLQNGLGTVTRDDSAGLPFRDARSAGS